MGINLYNQKANPEAQRMSKLEREDAPVPSPDTSAGGRVRSAVDTRLKQIGWNRAKLADAIRVKPNVIADLLNDNSQNPLPKPKPVLLEEIQKKLGVKVTGNDNRPDFGTLTKAGKIMDKKAGRGEAANGGEAK